MDRLLALWMSSKGIKTIFEETVSVPVDDFFILVEKTIMLLGQASNVISYQRRFSILFNLIKNARKAKSFLKDKATLIQKHDGNLFGKKFLVNILKLRSQRKKLWKCSKLQLVRQAVETPFQKVPVSIYTKKTYNCGRFPYARKEIKKEKDNQDSSRF